MVKLADICTLLTTVTFPTAESSLMTMADKVGQLKECDAFALLNMATDTRE